MKITQTNLMTRIVFDFIFFLFLFEASICAGNITFPDDISVPKYTEEQLAEFEKNVLSEYNLKIPSFLREAYLTGTNFLKKEFTSPSMSAEIDSYLYLSKKEGVEKAREYMANFDFPEEENSSEELYAANIEEILKKMQEISPIGRGIPFGMDACGNYFFAEQLNEKSIVWFHSGDSIHGWHSFKAKN